MKKNRLLITIFCILTLWQGCHGQNYKLNYPDTTSGNAFLLSRHGAIKALSTMSELNVCKASLTINEQILLITRNQRNSAMNRLDSLALLTNKTIVDNEMMKFDMQDLRKSRRKSRLENWIWRFGAIFTTYFVLKK